MEPVAEPAAPTSATVTSTSAAHPSGSSVPGASTPVTRPAAKAAATGAAKAAGKGASNKSASVVVANYGFQKYRVGVQVKSGAFVPPGTTTAGTELEVTDTPLSGPATSFACQTVAATAVVGSTATWCQSDQNLPTALANTARVKNYVASHPVLKKYLALHPDLTTGPTPPDAPGNQQFLAFPGDTVTITQTTVEPNLVTDTETGTVLPCIVPGDSLPFCSDSTDVVFDDNGLPPVATNDTATDVTPASVDINVLANDEAHGAPVTLTINGNPAHGTATVDASALTKINPAISPSVTTGPNITYKPDAGFLGIDHFTYLLSTPNGTSTATVTITVIAPPPTAVDDTATTDAGTPVTIHVTANDTSNGGGVLTVSAVSTPAHGSASISGTDVVYTPAAGFVGTDHFTYDITTPYGKSTATVTVTVNGAAVASTGTPSEQLLELGGALLLTGGFVTVAGRRRRAVHAD
jgi:hypothetical protein